MTVSRRRVLMMADLARYGSAIGFLQTRQADLLSLLEAAAAQAGLDPGSWYRQATGDGLFAVLPEGTDAVQAVIDFTQELNTVLDGYNGSLGAEPRLRLRIALAAGVSRMTQQGWAGQGVVTVARLAEAPVVKEALAGSPRANMAVVIDQSLYDDLAALHPAGFRADAWARVRVRAKELDTGAYLSVPGIGPAMEVPEARSEPAGQEGDLGWAQTADISGPRWLISAPAETDLRPLVAGLRERGILPFVMSDVARLGESFVQALQDAVLLADRVIVVLGDAGQSLNAAFEAGLAAALGKPLFVITPPGVIMPSDLSGFLTVRARPDDMDAIHFALDQGDALIPATAPHASAPGGALGPRADDLLTLADEIHALSSPTALERAFAGVVIAAIEASGGVVVDNAGRDQGFDLGVWSDDLGSIAANPLLIQLKRSISQQSVQQTLRAVQAHPSARAALLVYLEQPADTQTALGAVRFPLLAISLSELLAKMKEASFAEVVRQLRNQAVHGAAAT